jgi:superoxide dismutase, Cu-Zn family
MWIAVQPREVGRALRVALAIAASGSLLSCKTTDEAPKAAPPNIGARLARIGDSVMTGRVAFQRYDGGVTLAASLAGGSPGPWRVAIHTTGNCSSPNGFSAGPPVMLPGTSTPAVASVMVNPDKAFGEISVRLPGLSLEGPDSIVGKSVVVHAAGGSLEAEPGVRNNRAACGVIESMPSLF